MIRELPQETTSLRAADFPMEVEEKGEKSYILLLEIQTEWKAEKTSVLAEYYIRFQRKYPDRKIRPCMVLFLPSGKAVNRFQLESLTFEFELVKMWELEAAEYCSAEPEILPFIPLMKGGLELLDIAEAKLYGSRLNREDRADYLFTLALLTGLKDREKSAALFHRRRDVMVESALYEIIKEEGKLEGKIEGKIEGKLEDARRMLSRGYALEDVLEITGLTREQLQM